MSHANHPTATTARPFRTSEDDPETHQTKTPRRAAKYARFMQNRITRKTGAN